MKTRLRILLLVVMLPWTGSAADHLNLEEGLPTRIEDAYPTAFRNREVQASARFERTRDGEDRLTLEPRIELGLAPNTELRIAAPFLMGDADRTGSGDVHLSALYNFNVESLTLPAFAIEAEGVIPIGKNSRGFDTTLTFIATKSVSRTGPDRIHLNVGWHHDAGRADDEREHRYVAIVGYSRRVTADAVLVCDFVREQERERDAASNVVELGVRWQLTPLLVLSAGAGAGIGDESPRARGMIGLQKSF